MFSYVRRIVTLTTPPFIPFGIGHLLHVVLHLCAGAMYASLSLTRPGMRPGGRKDS